MTTKFHLAAVEAPSLTRFYNPTHSIFNHVNAMLMGEKYSNVGTDQQGALGTCL